MQYSSKEKLLAIVCHLSSFIGMPFLLPLVVYLVERGNDGVVTAHAREVLNFHISFLIYVAIAYVLILVLIGIPLLVLLGIVFVVCSLLGALKASGSELLHYPLTIRFLK